MKNILGIIILVVLAIGGTALYSQSEDKDMMNQDQGMEKEDLVTMEDTEMENMHDGKMMEISQEETMMLDDTMTMEPKAGSFVAYENTDISSLDGNIVLYFSANWCPTCRTLNKDIEAHINDIPSDLTIVLVDYDNHQDMRKEYQVTRQHTLVQIDQQGNKITMWSGGNTLDSIVSKVQ